MWIAALSTALSFLAVEPEAPTSAPPAETTELPPAEKAPEKPAEASVSWTLLGGQAPQGTLVASGAFGLSGLPQLTLHYALADDLSLGAVGAFDYARYIPAAGFHGNGSVAVSLKGSALLDDTLHLGWRADAGLRFPDLAILVDLSANLLAPVTPQLFVGAGVDVPLTIGLEGSASLVWPILVGGVAELRVLPPLSIFAEAKVGPAFLAPGGVRFGVRMMGGVAYRL